jgi:hypothetical protein
LSSARLVRVGRYVVPLSDEGVVRHFLGHHLVAHDVRERLCGAAARLSLALGLASAARGLVHVGYRPRGAATPWSTVIQDELSAAFQALDLPDAGVRMYLPAVDPRGGLGASGLVFGFGETGTPGPVAVLKVRRPGTGRLGLSREWQALCTLRRTLPEPLRDVVPQPIRYHEVEGLELLSMTCLPGRPVYLELHNRLISSRRVPVHMAAAVSWIIALHEATANPEDRVEEGNGLPDPGVLAEAASCHPGRAEQGQPLDDWYEELLEELWASPLARTASHGDYWARNLLLDEGRVRGVVDWEHHHPGGVPTTDLFHFLLTYGLAYRWTPFRRTPALVAFRRTFIEVNPISRGVRGALEMYARARRVPLARLGRLFLLHLLTRGAQCTASGVEQGPDPLPDRHSWALAYHIMRSSPRSVFTP